MININAEITDTSALFAQLDWQPLYEDHGIPLAIMGFIVVFAALIFVRVFIGLLPRIIAVLDHFYPEQPEVTPSLAPAGASTDEIPEEIIAVIAAAVADTVREPHRIVYTRELTSEDRSWTLEGRLKHHSSHTLPKTNR